MKLTLMQPKKEKRFKPQKQKALIQPNIQFADGGEHREGSCERVPEHRPLPPHPSTFFRDFEEVSCSAIRLLFKYKTMGEGGMLN
jgi:hypothetical protein